MKLDFQLPHLSITDFPSTVLPAFTLVTGLNGAGKTHLLRAIEKGDIRVDCAPDPPKDIRFFDWTNMLPRDTGWFDSHSHQEQRRALSKEFANALGQFLPRLFDTARTAGLTGVYLSDRAALCDITLEQVSSMVGLEKAPGVLAMVADRVDRTSQKVRGAIADPTRQRLLDSVAAQVNRPVLALTNDMFFSNAVSWGSADAFQQSFAELFVAYRDLHLVNLMKQTQQHTGHEVEYLSEEDFIKKYMIPPWDFVNEAFGQANLDFEIDQPDEYSYAPYQPVLTKRSSGARVMFNDLSSGEKILMSFALCLYYAHDRRQITIYPKLLLLDEIDAPLPSLNVAQPHSDDY